MSKMAKKLNQLLLTIFLFSIFSLGIVNSATTINTPAASSTVSGSTTFNVTFTDFVFGTNDFINLTFYAQSTLTANSSWATIGTNNSLNGTLLSNESITVIDLTGLIEDANNYIFNVTSTNSTGGTVLSEDTNTGITVDQTIPQAATSLSPANRNEDTDGSVTFSGTVTGANTTSCTLRFNGITPPGGNGQSMTHSGNSCTLTLSNIPQQTYNWYIRASDETNTTDSSAIDVTVKLTSTIGSAVGQALEQTGQIKKTSTGFSIIGNGEGQISSGMLIGIIIAIVVIIMIVRRK